MAALLAISDADSLPKLPAGREALGVYRIYQLGPSAPQRRELERFIENVFFHTYKARVGHFCDTLLGCRDEKGQWVAALGFTLATEGRVFLEQYLDSPIEIAIAEKACLTVERRQIAEVGNLASIRRGAARTLIAFMTRHLQSLGLSWVAFTATKSLMNSFTRLHIETEALADADPSRLPDGGRSWGRYYEANPQVMFGDIHAGYAELEH